MFGAGQVGLQAPTLSLGPAAGAEVPATVEAVDAYDQDWAWSLRLQRAPVCEGCGPVRLAELLTYQALVAGATDAHGNTMAAPYGWTFTTGDFSPPSVVGSDPPAGAFGRPTTTVVSAYFGEVLPSKEGIAFDLTGPQGTVTGSLGLEEVPGIGLPDPVGDAETLPEPGGALHFTPTVPLEEGAVYTATVAGALCRGRQQPRGRGGGRAGDGDGGDCLQQGAAGRQRDDGDLPRARHSPLARNKREGVPFVSKVDMAVEQIERFEPAASTHTHVLIDSWYHCRRVRRKAQARGWDVSGGLKSNRTMRLIAEDSCRTWQPLSQYAAQLDADDWQEVVWPSDQGGQTMYAHLIPTWVRKLAPTLLLVTCHDRAEPLKTVRYWGSTVMDFDAQVMVNVLAKRWDIYASRFAPLRAGFTATPTVGAAPLRVEFTDVSTPEGAAGEWLWRFGDGVTSTLASPVYTYTQAGVYTVTQWVTDTDTGETDALTYTNSITVYEPVTAGFTAWPTAGVTPLTVVLTNTSTGDYTSVMWSYGDGITDTVSAITHTHTYTVSDIYTVALQISGLGGTDALTRAHYLTVYPLPVTRTISYDYDPLYRLITATYSSGEVYAYTYDEVGNRLAMGVNDEVTAYEYDEANRLTEVDGVEYTWDDNGNLLADDVRTYDYDYANRLVQCAAAAHVSGTFTTTFAYNGDGHRMAKVENGETTTYTVAVLGLSQVLVETSGGESIVYLYGHDLLAEEGAGWAWHLGDGLGSVRQLVDGDGDVTLAQGYTPFGVPLWEQGNGATGYGFTGERWEAYNQLIFLRARYYDPGTGRFISRDSWEGDAEHPLTMHVFLYAMANPLVYTDPSGHVPMIDDEQCAQGWHPFFCPRPPKDMYWKSLGVYSFSSYGHADHEWFAKHPGVAASGKTQITWMGLDGQLHTADVYSKWKENIEDQQVAGKLRYENRYVWIKCPLGGRCQEKTETDAKKGGWGVALVPNKCVAFNPWENKDLKKNDTVCVRGLGALRASDHGTGRGTKEKKARWLDIYIGEHGYYTWTTPSPQRIWVLRPMTPLPSCQMDRCPIRWEELE